MIIIHIIVDSSREIKSFTNGTILETTWNHPFRRQQSSVAGDAFSIENSEWVEAKDLQNRDKAYSADGSLLVVDSVVIDHREETVYNFEVEDFHTYFVGEVGVWVHNADAKQYASMFAALGVAIALPADGPVADIAISAAILGSLMQGCVVSSCSEEFNNLTLGGAQTIDDFFNRPNINYAKSDAEYKKPKANTSGKEGAKDVPSWAKGNKPKKNEDGKSFADRLCDEKYGKGNYDKGPNSEHSKIKKWGDRSFE